MSRFKFLIRGLNRFKLMPLALLLPVLGASTLSGCGGGCRYKPIYLPYDEMRKVSWEEPRPIENNGRIIVYEDYLLVSEPGEGIHFFDNVAPESPQPLGFLKVPGASDMFIRNNALYVKSYVDLVLFDISNISNVHEISRLEFAFQFEPAKPGYLLSLVSVEDRLGVPQASPIFGIVVGYEDKLTCR